MNSSKIILNRSIETKREMRRDGEENLTTNTKGEQRDKMQSEESEDPICKLPTK